MADLERAQRAEGADSSQWLFLRVMGRNLPMISMVATAVATSLFFVGVPMVRAQQGNARMWDFETDQVGESPASFSFARTGRGRTGRWIVQEEKSAPSGTHVLAQVDTDPTDYRFPVAAADEPVLRDVTLSVRCNMIAGQVDRAAGLVFRYRDENNYYVTRANALEGNIRLYKVVNGRRQQFAGWDGPVTAGVWHQYHVEARGDHFEVFWDGQKVITANDKTFPKSGLVGVWTKADSVTYFDDLSVEPLGA